MHTSLSRSYKAIANLAGQDIVQGQMTVKAKTPAVAENGHISADSKSNDCFKEPLEKLPQNQRILIQF